MANKSDADGWAATVECRTRRALAGSLIASGGNRMIFSDPTVIVGNTWAGYWVSGGPDPRTLTLWVGGQNYVTARVDATVSSP